MTLSRLYSFIPNPIVSFHDIRRIVPDDINLARKNRKPHNHRNSNDRQIDARELESPDVDVLSAQDIAPEHAGQGRAEGKAESPVVDANGHAVDGAPEGAVGDWDTVERMDVFPGLDDARDEDCGSDVCACELWT